MASLDRDEGDLVNLAIIALIVIIIIAIYLAHKGYEALNPWQWFLKLLQEIAQWLEQEWQAFMNAFRGGGGAFLGSGNSNSSSLQVQDPNQLFQIPDNPLATISGLGSDLYPLQNVDIPGQGSDSPEPGGGVVSITGVQ